MDMVGRQESLDRNCRRYAYSSLFPHKSIHIDDKKEKCMIGDMSNLNMTNELRRRLKSGKGKSPKMSAYDLAAKSGVTPQFIYKILDGSQSPSVKIANRLASGLGCELKLVKKAAAE